MFSKDMDTVSENFCQACDKKFNLNEMILYVPKNWNWFQFWAENSWNRWNRSTWDPIFEKITKAKFLGFQNHNNIKVAYRNDTQPPKISDRSLIHSGVQRFLKFFTKGDFHEFFRNPTQIFPRDPTEVPTKFGHHGPKIGETTGSCSMWFQIEQPILGWE